MVTKVPDSLPVIKIQDLSKRYLPSAVFAVDSLNMTVMPGEIFGFLGPNGAGKTTTIRLLLDLIRPTSGNVQIMGMDCNKSSVHVRNKVGYLPAELSLYPKFNGSKLLKLFGSLRPGDVSHEYTDYICNRLDIDLDTQINRLSHGNRQKIGLLLALMFRSELLILDEPTTGLDPIVQHELLDILREVRSDGRTIFFSSHVLPDVEQICDRIGIIREGKLVTVEQVNTLRGRRIQRIRINFAESVKRQLFESLPDVKLIENLDTSIYLEVKGDIDLVVKAASNFKVVSMESDRPSLEEVFMGYYQGNEQVQDGEDGT